jgi:hypothetical protein
VNPAPALGLSRESASSSACDSIASSTIAECGKAEESAAWLQTHRVDSARLDAVEAAIDVMSSVEGLSAVQVELTVTILNRTLPQCRHPMTVFSPTVV